MWPDDLLVIAKRIAKGIPEIPIPRGPNERQCDYAARIQRMQAKYPVVLFLPEDQHAFEVGQAALELFEAVPHMEAPINAVNADVIHASGEAAMRLAPAGIVIPPELAVILNEQREILRFETTDEDSFIKRVRRKSGVYGEHLL
ncbi:MAG: hypothetical protein KDA88_21615 [Planctomycetaceae bacterium]|nr:hypothetical protein [Planctomycetaceae bacterium]MCB9951423.1 hypothetical protein [Planctomycetaceae bacterium]